MRQWWAADCYLRVGGIIGAAVGEVYKADMEDAKDRGDVLVTSGEKSALQGPPDTQAARNAGASDMKAAEAANPNRSNGSIYEASLAAKGMTREQIQRLIEQQGKSFEIEGELDGQSVVVDKHSPNVTENQLSARALAEQSETLQELEIAAKSNPVAEVLLGFRKHAEGMEPGPEKERLMKLAKEQAVELIAPRASDDQESGRVHLMAQNWDGLKQFGMDAGELALEKTGVFVHRGNEDKFVDYKAAQEAVKTSGLDKFGLSNNFIGAIMRNEQHFYKNTDADQDKQVREKGTVLKDGKEDSKASIGPAQMQIRNIKHLVNLKNPDGKPEYPYLQHMKGDPLRGALDAKNAALLVAAYSKEIVKDLQAHGIQKPSVEQVIYLYNDDVNSYGTGKEKTFISVSAPGSATAEKLLHSDLRRERIPNDPRILEKSVHVRHVLHALDEVNKKNPLLEAPIAPGHKHDTPRQEKSHKTGPGTNNQEFTV